MPLTETSVFASLAFAPGAAITLPLVAGTLEAETKSATAVISRGLRIEFVIQAQAPPGPVSQGRWPLTFGRSEALTRTGGGATGESWSSNLTTVPGRAIAARLTASQFVSRMQPCDS